MNRKRVRQIVISWGILWLVGSVCAMEAGAQQCSGDFNNDGHVDVNELVVGVNRALSGCSIYNESAKQAARRAFAKLPEVQGCTQAGLATWEAGSVEVLGEIGNSCGVAGCYSTLLVSQTFRITGVNPQSVSVLGEVVMLYSDVIRAEIIGNPSGPCTGYSLDAADQVAAGDGGS